MNDRNEQTPPILRNKEHDTPSAFTPESLLREARRQKGADRVTVPKVCLLDPDGDIVRQLHTDGRARKHEGWVCYHTEMWVFDLDEYEIGVVGCAVGASFAVLVAEEMFASGCELLISVTSSGQITPQGAPPYFILIDRALRDEGTSYHYLPPSDWSVAPAFLLSRLDSVFGDDPRVLTGATWTTDAPFRETETAIEAARGHGILAVEMEAAGLYAFAEARGCAVICLAHVTNQMGAVEGDFEKGEANGTADALAVVSRIVHRIRRQGRPLPDFRQLETKPAFEREELSQIYAKRGIEPYLARQVADQLMAKDALGAHAQDELGISKKTTARPVLAALTSAATFAVGAVLPLAMVLVSPPAALIPAVSGASLLFLALLGAVGARTGGATIWKAALRVTFWGALAMPLTAGIGALVGTVV